MKPISRRRALQLGGLGLVTAAAGGAGLVVVSREEETSRSSGRPSLTEPDVLSSSNGLLEVTLEAAEGTHQVAGREATTYAYNGSVPGPTLRLHPGDTLRITLVNKLDAGTNLHTHGLHVSPEGNADNVFVHIGAGESFDYEYQLPDDHPPGAYWYHPHLHELVADQLFGGMYGAIVVEEPDDLPVTRERLLVIGDTTLDGSGRVVQVTQMERMMGREGELVLVNGQLDPAMAARPGERERWRVINACNSRFLFLRLDGQRVEVLGMDSGRFAAPRVTEEVFLAPGNRADLVVTAAAGTSVLEAVPYDRFPGERGGMMPRGGRLQDDTGPVRLATFEVAGSRVSPLPALPAQPQPRNLASAAVARTRQLTFAIGGQPGFGGGAPGFGRLGPRGMQFTIDGRQFDAHRIDQEVALDTVEEWTISNVSPMDHPFHLHVWPMQVLEDDGGPVDTPTWKDVVNLPAGGSVKVRIPFETFAGKTVYHCHILDHEDLGMMGVVQAR